MELALEHNECLSGFREKYICIFVLSTSARQVCKTSRSGNGVGDVRGNSSNVEQRVLFTVPSRQVMQLINFVIAPYGAFEGRA